MTRWDEIISSAVADAAAAISRADSQSDVGELAHLQPALLAALRARFGLRVATGQAVAALPDWLPAPGNVDVVIAHDASSSVAGSPQVGIELKSYKLDETIWDIIKMASLRRMFGVEAAYVIVAAIKSKFSRKSDCAALFQMAPDEAIEWDSASFFSQWPKAWCDLLRGGRGRPTRLPDTISLRLVCRHEIAAFPKWEVRALRVENPIRHAWLELTHTGWPVGQKLAEEYEVPTG